MVCPFLFPSFHLSMFLSFRVLQSWSIPMTAMPSLNGILRWRVKIIHRRKKCLVTCMIILTIGNMTWVRSLKPREGIWYKVRVRAAMISSSMFAEKLPQVSLTRHHFRSMLIGECKKDGTPVSLQWSYVFLVLTHWCKVPWSHESE